MQKVLNFIKYNNAFTIIFVICFFSFGISFAESQEVRDSIYSSKETVVSIDNSLVVLADLDNFNFNLRINSVSDDEKNYYATYSYQTLMIEDSIWQNRQIEKTLTVSKEALGGKDLGLYLAQELGDNISYELSYLKRVKALEKEKGQSQKVVTVEYSGLVGKLLDPKEKVIEGYNPVIPEVIEKVPATAESRPESVIVSTPYSEPQKDLIPEAVSSQTEILQNPTGTSTPSETETLQELTQPPPTAEEMIDEELVQEVVGELLQNNASSTPVLESATSVPEAVSESTQ